MTLAEIAEQLELEARTKGSLDVVVTDGYAGDLLSDVLANSSEGALWITLQIHPNVVAIASMKGLSGIVLTSGREPEEETVAKAEEENVVILVSQMSAFELSGRLYTLMASGK